LKEAETASKTLGTNFQLAAKRYILISQIAIQAQPASFTELDSSVQLVRNRHPFIAIFVKNNKNDK